MVFQGQPYENVEFEEATCNQWADEDGPLFQLVPLGYRGYIEGRPVRRLDPGV